ncbi:hypothetical protein DEO72_LG9g960 [Vigna unguiculata]|uniref:Uncharacterized protein n=1 Tax=Vigna unguiculata TaxID=3917 RepID=A0A4D6MZA8_VIGUN|nr:hypothetical protein DEO72_LG9g960 [Vigna unguiculata]
MYGHSILIHTNDPPPSSSSVPLPSRCLPPPTLPPPFPRILSLPPQHPATKAKADIHGTIYTKHAGLGGRCFSSIGRKLKNLLKELESECLMPHLPLDKEAKIIDRKFYTSLVNMV